MSITERYVRATRSSDLELKVEVSDVDYLIAAGLVQVSLATRLIRLRSDFDALVADPGRRVVMTMLRGFPITQRFLVAYAIQEAPIRSRDLDDESAARVAMQVLDLFLDPNCPGCDGRGFTGGYGVPTLRCPACRESGKRLLMWKTDAQEHFAKWLLSSIEGKIDRASHEMRRLMRVTQ